MPDTIAIIGGGPAGTSCAIKLIKEAGVLRKNIRVVMFEGKYFETHYNQCVGVLSPPLLKILKEELGIELPRDLIKRRIFAYRLHVDKEEIFLVGEEKEGPTYTVHRVNFDKFMLDFAKKIGVEIIHSRVNGLEFIRTKELQEVRVYSESGYLRADAVVCAFGLDESMLNILEESTKSFCPYKRPKKFLRTFITKLETASGFIEKKLGNIIYAYLMPINIPNIEFGAISPKGEHIVINIAGEKITSLDLDKFLKLPQVRKHLPEFKIDNLSYFEGHFPIAPAVNCFGDRFLVAGDATGWMRSFKGKGINTAIITGIEAAKVLIESDFSKDNFKKYENRARELLSDYYYGMLVRYFCKWGARFKFLNPLIKAARVDQNIYEALYDAVSGHNTYKNIFKNLLYFNLTKTLKRLFFGKLKLRKLFSGGRKMEEIKIRKLSARDVESIFKIDEKITGHPSATYWEGKVVSHMQSNPSSCLVAEIGEKVVGFIFGDIRGWEFNIPLSGWIDVMGVDPDYQGKGIGKKLIQELFNYFKQSGVNLVHTLINWNDADLVDYFRSIDFKIGEFIHLEKELE